MESQKKRDSRRDFAKRAITGTLLIVAFWAVFFRMPPIVFTGALAGILGIIILTEWPRFFKTTNPTFWLLMPLYPILPMVLTALLNHHPTNRLLIVYTMVIVFCFDFGSYAFGSLFGMHKIAPEISPRKTWEGAVGGFLFSYITLTTILRLSGTTTTLFIALHTTFALPTLALCGDFFESLLKRRAGIKDSGNLLPGHGGFLDRLDGILFAMPVVFLFQDYFARVFGLVRM